MGNWFSTYTPDSSNQGQEQRQEQEQEQVHTMPVPPENELSILPIHEGNRQNRISRQCLIDTLSQSEIDPIDRNDLESMIKSCIAVPAETIEQFGGISQSSDANSICVNYNTLFWLVIIIIIAVLLMRCNKQ